MSAYPWANLPAVPFPRGVHVPAADVTDEPTVCLTINGEWLSYIIGACAVLTRQSTWADDDPSKVDHAVQQGYELLHILANPETCPVPVQFRLNPDDAHYWDYSNDGGVTWNRQPDTVSHFTPAFVADGGVDSGYDLTVNGGLSSDAIPLLIANDPDAIVKDPASLVANLITASAGADGLLIRALAIIGVKLVQSNGVALALQKVFPGLELATSVLEIVAGTDYSYPLVETVDSI